MATKTIFQREIGNISLDATVNRANIHKYAFGKTLSVDVPPVMVLSIPLYYREARAWFKKLNPSDYGESFTGNGGSKDKTIYGPISLFGDYLQLKTVAVIKTTNSDGTTASMPRKFMNVDVEKLGSPKIQLITGEFSKLLELIDEYSRTLAIVTSSANHKQTHQKESCPSCFAHNFGFLRTTISDAQPSVDATAKMIWKHLLQWWGKEVQPKGELRICIRGAPSRPKWPMDDGYMGDDEKEKAIPFKKETPEEIIISSGDEDESGNRQEEAKNRKRPRSPDEHEVAGYPQSQSLPSPEIPSSPTPPASSSSSSSASEMNNLIDLLKQAMEKESSKRARTTAEPKIPFITD